MDAVIIPILQRRKLRHREIAQHHIASPTLESVTYKPLCVTPIVHFRPPVHTPWGAESREEGTWLREHTLLAPLVSTAKLSLLGGVGFRQKKKAEVARSGTQTRFPPSQQSPRSH